MNLSLKLAVLYLILFTLLLAADDKIRIAVTFDDLVVVGRHLNITEIEKMTDALLSTLKKHEIQSVGFVNESKLYKNNEYEQRKAILSRWLKAGQELGNHTFSHPDYHRTDFKEYSADIIKGEKTSAELLSRQKQKLRYFRHPFLRNGNSKEKKSSLRQFLKDHGYTVAPVTIENVDYIFADLYAIAKAENDSETMKMVEEEYLAFTEKMFEYFEQASITLLGRQIDHVLLLHANELNAACLERMCKMMLNRGFAFSSLEEVLKDEAYALPDNWLGNAGTNWLFRWDYSLNDPKKVDWRKQPVPSEQILKMFKEAKAKK